MSSLEEIVPKDRQLVMDLVREAGVNVSDWKNFKGGERKAASNPKYCYQWSFVEPNKVVVLNLWHASMREHEGIVVQELNMRQLARQFGRASNQTGERRAITMDVAVQTAVREGLPVRVVVCEGERRDVDDASSKASRVHKRLLDPVPWAITAYDWSDGRCSVTRGARPGDVAGARPKPGADGAPPRADAASIAATHWTNDDVGYEGWLRAHPRGFMANVNNPPSGRYLKIHRASHNLADRSNEGSTNPRTGGYYSKVTADQLDDLLVWASKNLPGLGGIHPGNYCEVCAPEDDSSNQPLPTTDFREYLLMAERVRARGQVARPVGNLNPGAIRGEVSLFYRDPAVRAWTLQRAAGQCELCERAAPFVTDHSAPYLESHHIVTLAEGGPDTPDNTAALCPNCHRSLHYSAERGELRAHLATTIARKHATEGAERGPIAGTRRGDTDVGP